MSRTERRLLGGVITVLVIGSVIALQYPAPGDGPRYVIIHADDAGMYPSVNSATIEAMERGVVSSCSIMIPCPGFDDFAKYARSHPEKDFGVHLTLNCDTDDHRWGPVLPREQVPSLVDRDGYLWKSRRQVAENAKLEEAESELRAQIDKALAAEIPVTHLDHHLFVLYERPDLLQLYVRLGVEYNLPLRYTREPTDADLNVDDPSLLRAFRRGLGELQGAEMPILDHCDSKSYYIAAAEKHAYYCNALAQVTPGVTEILVHCAYNAPGMPAAPDIALREADTRVLCSPDYADLLKRGGIRIISWKDFRKLARSR